MRLAAGHTCGSRTTRVERSGVRQRRTRNQRVQLGSPKPPPEMDNNNVADQCANERPARQPQTGTWHNRSIGNFGTSCAPVVLLAQALLRSRPHLPASLRRAVGWLVVENGLLRRRNSRGTGADKFLGDGAHHCSTGAKKVSTCRAESSILPRRSEGPPS